MHSINTEEMGMILQFSELHWAEKVVLSRCSTADEMRRLVNDPRFAELVKEVEARYTIENLHEDEYGIVSIAS